MNAKNVTYFDKFGIEDNPKEIRKIIGKNMLKQTFIEYKHTIR